MDKEDKEYLESKVFLVLRYLTMDCKIGFYSFYEIEINKGIQDYLDKSGAIILSLLVKYGYKELVEEFKNIIINTEIKETKELYNDSFKAEHHYIRNAQSIKNYLIATDEI